MLFARSFVRALPRRLPTCSFQPARTLISVPKLSPLQGALTKPTDADSRSFLDHPGALGSTRRIGFVPRTISRQGQRCLTQNAVDSELSAKLQSELQNEREANESNTSAELPPHLREYLTTSPFELQDASGSEEVVLVRTFGNEKIRVSFSIADLTNLDQDADAYRDDNALYDEDVDGAGKEPPLNQGGRPGAAPTAPEDAVAPADREAAGEAPDAAAASETSFPAHLTITIEKQGAPGALLIEATAKDGTVMIENAYYFAKAELAEGKTAEQDYVRRGLYSGPPFGNLDEDLQVLLERYIEERGVNTALALWVPDYVDYKEQKEYVDWLSDVKDFVDA